MLLTVFLHCYLLWLLLIFVVALFPITFILFPDCICPTLCLPVKMRLSPVTRASIPAKSLGGEEAVFTWSPGRSVQPCLHFPGVHILCEVGEQAAAGVSVSLPSLAPGLPACPEQGNDSSWEPRVPKAHAVPQSWWPAPILIHSFDLVCKKTLSGCHGHSRAEDPQPRVILFCHVHQCPDLISKNSDLELHDSALTFACHRSVVAASLQPLLPPVFTGSFNSMGRGGRGGRGGQAFCW